MAPNRRSIPPSLSLSDSSDPESWGTSASLITTTRKNNIGNVKGTGNGLVTLCEPNGSISENTNGHSNGHYIDSKMLQFNHLKKNDNKILNGGNEKDVQLNNCVSLSSKTQSLSSSSTSSSSPSTPSKTTTINHSINLHNNQSHHWRNWPKIDLINSIDPFESTDSMISAFACVAHVINSDSANEDDQVDGDNEINRIDYVDCEPEHGGGSGCDDDDGNGSYDSSNHSNSLESPENYRPIHKPQSLGYNNNNNNNNIIIEINGKCSSSNDRFTTKSDQVNVIKPSPPPLATLPRPLHQPPISLSPSSSLSTSTTITTNTNTSPSTLISNNNNLTSQNVPTSSSSSTQIATPVTAKDHLYETIYPSNIRLTRDSKYFVDYQNYRSILNKPVDQGNPSLSSNNNKTNNSINQQQHITYRSFGLTNDNNNRNNNKEMVRRSNYNATSTIGVNKGYKNFTSRSSTASPTSTTMVNHSFNQKKTSPAQRSTLQNYHHPHHQHHLPGHQSNHNNLTLSPNKPSLSSSSASLLSPPLPSSASPLTESNHRQGYHHAQSMKKCTENSPPSSSASSKSNQLKTKSSNTTINRTSLLQVNSTNKSLHKSYDQVDGKQINQSPSATKSINGNLTTTVASSLHNDEDNCQPGKPSNLQPDQVYPNTISMPIISRAAVRSTEEYATVNKARTIKAMKSATLTPSSINNINYYKDEAKLLSKDDSILKSQSKASESPMSLTLSLSSSSSTPNSPATPTSNQLIVDTKNQEKGGKGSKSKSKLKSSSSPLSSPSTSTSSSSRSFLSKFFSLTHAISRTFSVEKIDKHHQRASNVQGKSNLIKSAVSTPALLSSSSRSGFFTDLNGNHSNNDNLIANLFTSTRTLTDSGDHNQNNQENIEPVSLTTSTSGSKSLQIKSTSASSAFVRAFKSRLSLRRSRRKVKVKVDVTRTKSDPRGSKANRFEEDKTTMFKAKEETIHGSIVSSPSDYLKVVEIHRPAGKPFGFFVARGTVNNIKGIFISRIDPNGEKAYQGLIEIGDRLIEIDGNDVTEASVIQVNQLMSNKTKLMIKIVPFSVIANKSVA